MFNRNTGICAGFLHALNLEHVFFSHYLYAEIVVEFCIVVATILIFRNGISLRNFTMSIMASLWMGLGMLIKHFIVIPAFSLGLIVILFLKQRRKILVGMVFAFMLPLVSYSIFLWSEGEDWGMFINSPIKSAREWKVSMTAPAGFQTVEERKSKMLDLVQGYTQAPFWETVEKFKWNLFRLWSPGTYVLRRVVGGRYPSIKYRWLVASMGVFIYGFLLVAGLVGLCLGPRSIFNYYSAFNIFLVSCLPLFLFMMSRYRIPFFFILILHAAYAIVQWKTIRQQFYIENWPRLSVLLISLIVVVTLFYDRIPDITAYQ